MTSFEFNYRNSKVSFGVELLDCILGIYLILLIYLNLLSYNVLSIQPHFKYNFEIIFYLRNVLF